MPKLSDLMAGETADATRAAGAAAAGQSLTGLSGRLAERGRGLPEPIFGERVRLPVNPDSPRAGEGVGEAAPPGRWLRDGRERVPFGNGRQQLAWPKEPGFRHYWFNDVPGRIEDARRAGYDHIRDPITQEPVAIVTDRTVGGGRKSYLMKCPIEFYVEDMSLREEADARMLDEIREGQSGPGAKDKRYIPQQGISVSGR